MAGRKIKCMECKAVIQSMHRHDYKTCGCPNETMVDGGDDYLRFGFKRTAPEWVDERGNSFPLLTKGDV